MAEQAVALCAHCGQAPRWGYPGMEWVLCADCATHRVFSEDEYGRLVVYIRRNGRLELARVDAWE